MKIDNSLTKGEKDELIRKYFLRLVRMKAYERKDYGIIKQIDEELDERKD